ncbi:MAG: HAD family hydrolase [Erysipelotrichaceae bacterium]
MDYKIAFFDMDHTLYESHEDMIHQEDLAAIQLLRDQGVLICAATGRPLNQMNRILNYIKFDYLVLINGAYVLDGDYNIMYKNPIPQAEVNEIVSWTKQHHYPLSFHFGDQSYIYWGAEEQDSMWKRFNITSGICKIDNPEYHLTHSAYNAIITADFEDMKDFLKKHEDLQSCFIQEGTYDVYSKLNNKSLGIEYLLNHLNLTWNDTITFGDSTNDLEMLEKAKLGIAMENGDELAKQCANYVSDSIHHSGVAKAIHKILNHTLV